MTNISVASLFPFRPQAAECAYCCGKFTDVSNAAQTLSPVLCVTQSPGKHKHLPNEVCTSKATVVGPVVGDVHVVF